MSENREATGDLQNMLIIDSAIMREPRELGRGYFDTFFITSILLYNARACPLFMLINR